MSQFMESDLSDTHDGGYDIFTDHLAMTWFVAELRRDGYTVDISELPTGGWLVEWFRSY